MSYHFETLSATRPILASFGIGKLLTPERGNAKLAKSGKDGRYMSVGLSLAPFTLASDALDRKVNVCPSASAGCASLCLNTAGQGRYDNVQAARIRKTTMLFRNRPAFLSVLRAELRAAQAMADRQGKTLVIRLNVLSDLTWETLDRSLFSEFNRARFYDYTKIVRRMSAKLPENYHLTFSRSEVNEDDALTVLRNGRNVAVVFGVRKGKDLPSTWHGFPVVDGDINDLRIEDPAGVVVGLRAKGRAVEAINGFVVR